MKKYRAITAAETDESKLIAIMDRMEEDFAYLMSGFEKLDRTDATASNQGLMIAEQLNSAIQQAIEQIADYMTGGEQE